MSRTRYVAKGEGVPVASDPGSTVPRRQLGRHLRELREQARITVKTAAEELEWSTPKLWRIETGATSMRALDVQAMCRLYGASDEVTSALMGLARETRARGWWHAHGDAVPAWFELYVGLECAATRLREYQPELIPGLLQTGAYASEVFRVHHPEMSDVDVARGVALRRDRQTILTRARPAPPRLEVVVNEAALRRPIADLGKMSDQLDHLAVMAELPNVSLRVLPLTAGLHPAAMTGGMFIILEFSGESRRRPEPPVVYSEGLDGAHYLEKPSEVAAYDRVWSGLVGACLCERDSYDLVRTMAKEYAAG